MLASQNKRNQKTKKGTSKKITHWIFYITVAFFLFMGFMMLKTGDLSPSEYLANIIMVALPIGIIAYMYRAVMEDKMELQLRYNSELAKDRKKYGEHYVVENLDEPDFLKRS